MASTLFSFQPARIRASVSSGRRKPHPSSRKATHSNWWSPIFGWGSDSDYIDGHNKNGDSNNLDLSVSSRNESEADSDKVRSRSRFEPGCFTEEKAKQLRLKAMETATFHDIMYHSAIASRLASDLPNRSDR